MGLVAKGPEERIPQANPRSAGGPPEGTPGSDQAFPLELKVPNSATQSAMKESRAKLKAGKKRFATAADLIDDLEKARKH